MFTGDGSFTFLNGFVQVYIGTGLALSDCTYRMTIIMVEIYRLLHIDPDCYHQKQNGCAKGYNEYKFFKIPAHANT